MKKFVNFTSSNFVNLWETNITKKSVTLLPKNEIFGSESSLLCLISGGQDSILTFFILLHIDKKLSLQVLYCQHFWQLKNFFTARFLFQMSYLIKVPYILILPQNILLSENESRDWRKQNFSRVSQIEHILMNFIGHTETDIVEKNLNNLLRGASPGGFSSLTFLNSKNRVCNFFSTININTCFFFNFKKKQKFKNLQFFGNQTGPNPIKLVFCHKNKNFDRQLNRVLIKKQSFFPLWNSLESTRSSQRKYFQFYKRLKTFDQKQLSLTKNKPDSNFFNSPNYLLKNQLPKSGTHTKSYSFCFSNQSFIFQIDLQKPLENITRFSVSKLVKFYRLPIIIDITNFSGKFSRNKIRHQLIPFIRSLVHPNIEFLLTHFFKMIDQDTKDRKEEIEELDFLYKLGNAKYINTKICYEPEIKRVGSPLSLGSTHSKNKFFGHDSNFIKSLLKNISATSASSLIQILFFEYKNLKLNYSQNFKLKNFC